MNAGADTLTNFTANPTAFHWAETRLGWSIIAIAALLFVAAFAGDIQSLYHTWTSQEEYSHGILIPFISAFLIYQKSDRLQLLPFTGSWLGVGIVLFGVLLHLAGRMAVVSTLGQYALVIALAGLFLALMGWQAFRLIIVAMAMLAFMVKLPTFIYHNLSSELQLISSQIGVWFIRLFDISVYLEGNVIDLGAMKLQVVEACNGLRYLFPLMALSLILAIFYKASFWRKALVFLSSMPITVLMNSFRIGAIGVTVEYWGKEMAEGFLHDFEGWVVFMAAFLVIFAEIILLNKLVGEKRPLAEVLSLELPARSDPAQQRQPRKIPYSFYAALVVLALFFAASQNLKVGDTVHPARTPLSQFPLAVGEWFGLPSRLDPVFLQELQLDDYIVADYRAGGGKPINFYVAYYNVQAEGEGTIHSPRSCLPGSGWRIKTLTQQTLPDIQWSGTPVEVNRAIIAKDQQQVLVYYWLQQRGRVITNEFMAKWWIFWDRIFRNRTDGALVRVMVEIEPFADISVVEQRLQTFVAETVPLLHKHIPD